MTFVWNIVHLRPCGVICSLKKAFYSLLGVESSAATLQS